MLKISPTLAELTDDQPKSQAGLSCVLVCKRGSQRRLQIGKQQLHMKLA